MWISPIMRPKASVVVLGNALEMGGIVEGRVASQL